MLGFYIQKIHFILHKADTQKNVSLTFALHKVQFLYAVPQLPP